MKKILFAALILVLSIGLIGCGNDEPSTAVTENSSTPTPTPTPAIDSDVQLFMDATGMTQEAATEANEAFDQISTGISVIYSVTYDEMLNDLEGDGTMGYRIKTEFSNNVIMYTLEGRIYSICYADTDFYINGTVQNHWYDANGQFIHNSQY